MKTKTKTSLLVGLMLISVFASIPAFVVGTGGDGGDFDFTDEIIDNPELMFDRLGNIFGMFENLGPSGAALGKVFSVIFKNIWDFQIQEFSGVKHVYLLEATTSETHNETWTSDQKEMYFLNNNLYNVSGADQPYVLLERSGEIEVTYTTGASVVLLIWDDDDSFVITINKILQSAHNIKEILESGTSDEQMILNAVGEVVEALVYFFFHINDFITGDELIILNMVTWETYSLNYTAAYTETRTVSIWDDWNLDDDVPLTTEIAGWQADAITYDDEFTQAILADPSWANATVSKFTFNTIQIWLKTFQININVDKMVDLIFDAGNATIDGSGQLNGSYVFSQIFQGFEIDIYIITHSLFGFLAYDDVDLDGKPSVEKASVTETVGEQNVTSEFITDSEVEYYFVPEFTNEDVTFIPAAVTAPDADGDVGVKWSVRIEGLTMSAIPINNGPETTPDSVNDLTYLELGFTFIPKLKQEVSGEDFNVDVDEVKMSQSVFKMDQYFGQWSGDMSAFISPDLDFAVVYMSTIIHFHIKVEVESIEEEVEAGLIDQTEQEANVIQTGQIKVGDKTGNLPVAGVDIAGPGYWLDLDPGMANTTNPLPASTTTIPLAWLNYTARAQANYVDSQNATNSFSVSGFLNIEASMLIYAVSYPAWDGSGMKIAHDPTFSVFMTWDNPGFWAVILVVAGISLVAVAAILITRRKNRV
jgi:hypothetical protein